MKNPTRLATIPACLSFWAPSDPSIPVWASGLVQLSPRPRVLSLPAVPIRRGNDTLVHPGGSRRGSHRPVTITPRSSSALSGLCLAPSPHLAPAFRVRRGVRTRASPASLARRRLRRRDALLRSRYLLTTARRDRPQLCVHL